MTSEDPERLLSEALRAQAIRARAAEPSPVEHVLLSGTDLDVAPAAPHRAEAAPNQVHAFLVLSLALLLGLAAGAVIGLLTLF